MWKYIISILLLILIILMAYSVVPLKYVIYSERIRIDTAIDPTPINNIAFVRWVRFEDPKLLENRCIELGIVPVAGKYIAACSEIQLKKKTCTIYSINPKSIRDEAMNSLGHETLHCFNGSYHK